VSVDNVALARRAFQLLAAGDVDALAELLHEDGELHSATAGALTGAVYCGVAGVRQYVADLTEVWERFDQVPEEFIDLADGAVLVIVRLNALGRTSGVEVNQRGAAHITFKDGKVWRVVGYSSVEEARFAVGLR